MIAKCYILLYSFILLQIELINFLLIGFNFVDASTSDTSLNDNNNLTSVEGEPKKLPYPKSVFFIISNEFCERFNYYGMRSEYFSPEHLDNYYCEIIGIAYFHSNSGTVFDQKIGIQ